MAIDDVTVAEGGSRGHETFTVRLSNPRNATLSDSEGTATIRDDEYSGVRVSYSASSYAVAEGASVSVAVVLSAAPERPVTIALTHSPGAGAGPNDYSGVPAETATGLGFEVGGGVRYAHPAHHLTAEIYSRALLVHAANGFSGWSASGSLRYDPRSDSAQGPYLTVTTSGGFGGSDRQVNLGLAGLTDAAASEDSAAGWGVETEFGYGVLVPGGAAIGTPWAGLSLSQGRPEYRLGYRLEYDTGLRLSLAATLRDGRPGHEPPRYLLTLLLSLRS